MSAGPSRARLALVAPVVAAIAGCSSTAPAATPRVSPPAPTVVPSNTTTAPVTPSATTVGPGVTVIALAAAPAAVGTVVFVVVMNDAVPRGPLTVSVAAASSNGRGTVTRATVLRGLAPEETTTAMVRLSIPADDTIGAVTAAATGTPGAAGIDPLTVSGATFAADPIEPTVAVTVATARTVAAVVVAACYAGSTLVGGGVVVTQTVAPGPPRAVALAAAVTQTPTRCVGSAYPA